ncbi:hypothetical protein SYNPS1DRAFT_27575 [Syncephalis pseudoplumigaleata]|uniref:Uncharacterized protein n=1 Tax=Syncephalis pseudoplumigaleata TaxID=1712513 RepID=A0A4V1J1Z2_9FUNG|nr:hypothetical protein SYNPS1DRAFT_27575 [Syncephalis pseudoplumigaleata]|eukprot:RKP26749.1 hypothetical protein SYNPS1DRAFT_27575 [Syncephalis pseudoplumigaleata]
MVLSGAVPSRREPLPALLRVHAAHRVRLPHRRLRAYLASRQQLWVAIVGGLFIVPQAGYAYVGMRYSPVVIDADYGCVSRYPTSVPLYWSCVFVPSNAFLSGIFSYIAYKQYQAYGSDAWRRLRNDGIQSMCLVIVCNIICSIFTLMKVGNDFAQVYFIVDWLVTSIILVNHTAKIRKAASSLIASQNHRSNRREDNTSLDIRETITTLPNHFALSTIKSGFIR